MTDKQSAGLAPLVSRNAHFEAVAAALNIFVGRGKRYCYKTAERGSGVSARMIEAYRHPCDHPEWRPIKPEELASLFRFFGPEFTTEYLAATTDQGAFWLPNEGDIPPGEIAADIAEASAVVTRAAADGKFDGEEKPDLRVVGPRLMAEGARLLALGKAA